MLEESARECLDAWRVACGLPPEPRPESPIAVVAARAALRLARLYGRFLGWAAARASLGAGP